MQRDRASLWVAVDEKSTSKDSPDLCWYGVLIQVKEVAKVRAFYRDVLDLGEPILDSTYYVEFALPGGGLLILQQCEYAVEDTCGDTAWLLCVEEPGPIVKRLEAKGLVPIQPPRAIPGRQCISFADPEGNLFTLLSRQSG